jgi:hypothetical protein
MRLQHSSIWLAAVVVAAAALPARAHDTWFARQDDGTLTLATGNRFPAGELAVDPRYFVHHGCRAEPGAKAEPLVLLRYSDTASLLRAPAATARVCWVQLQPFEFELPPDKIDLYFREIRPPAAILQAWAALRARGLPFLERYTKSARIDLAAAAGAPVGIPMDVLRETAAPNTGAEAVFQVLREGRPLPEFNVELVHERSPLGLWFRTDAQGRVRATLPLPGRWLMRGTDLRVSPADPTRFESQFLAYSFDVAAAAR